MTNPLVPSPRRIRALAHEFLRKAGDLATLRQPLFQLSHVVFQTSTPDAWQKMKESLFPIAATRQEEDAQGRKVLWAVLKQPLEHRKYRLRGIALPYPQQPSASESCGSFTCIVGILENKRSPSIIQLSPECRMVVLAEVPPTLGELEAANPVRPPREPRPKPHTFHSARMVHA